MVKKLKNSGKNITFMYVLFAIAFPLSAMDKAPSAELLKFECASRALVKILTRCDQGYPIEESQDKIKQLLADSADPNLHPVNGHTLLHAAVMSDRKDLVELMISIGADINYRYFTGATALGMAVRTKTDLEIVRMLLQAGADIDEGIHGNILGSAVLFGSSSHVKFLLDQGLDPNSGFLLHAAAHCQREETLQLLLDAGADPDIKNEKEYIALDIARHMGYRDMERLFTDRRPKKIL